MLRDMVACIVPGCDTGKPWNRKQNKLEGKRNPSLFRVPRDQDTKTKWMLAIPKGKTPLNFSSGFVCELHFKEDVIQKYFVTRMSDGTDHKFERAKQTLKPGAIPTIFPTTLESPKRASKSPRINTKELVVAGLTDTEMSEEFAETLVVKLTAEDEEISCSSFEDNDSIESEVLMTSYDDDDTGSEHPTSFINVLMNDISTVKVPSQSWTATLVKSEGLNAAVWTYYEMGYSICKRIVIDENLVLKVFLREREVTINGIQSPDNAEDVTAILQIVQDLRLCAAVGSKFDLEHCLGYVITLQQDEQVCPVELCPACASFLQTSEARKSTRTFFDVLLNDITIVKMPSVSWSPAVVNNIGGLGQIAATWAYHEMDFTISRRVLLIGQDMLVKVFLNERELTINGIQRLDQPEDVTDILKAVQDLQPCAGVDSSLGSDQCIGFVIASQQDEQGCPMRLCQACTSVLERSEEKKSTKTLFDVLLNDITTVELPSESWFPAVVNNLGGLGIKAATWNYHEKDFSISKRVLIIGQDLLVKVFLKEKEFSIKGIQRLDKVLDVAAILNTVQDLRLCAGVDSTLGSKQCIGYVISTDDDEHGSPMEMCPRCASVLQTSEAGNVSRTFMDVLLKDITSVEVPTEPWSAAVVKNVGGLGLNAAVWTYHEMDFSISKRVLVIGKDLQVKVFLKEKEVTIDGIHRPKTFEDVTFILNTVQDLRFCIGVSSQIRSEPCIGYVLPPRRKRCHTCKVLQAAKSRQEEQEIGGENYLRLKNKVKCISKTNKDLQKKIMVMQIEMSVMRKIYIPEPTCNDFIKKSIEMDEKKSEDDDEASDSSLKFDSILINS